MIKFKDWLVSEGKELPEYRSFKSSYKPSNQIKTNDAAKALNANGTLKNPKSDLFGKK